MIWNAKYARFLWLFGILLARYGIVVFVGIFILKISNKDRVGIVSDNESEHESIAFCRHCEKFGIRAVLGPRQNYTERDADKWRECTHCRRIYPIYEIKHEGKLVGLIEPEVNPFKSTGEVVGLDNKIYSKVETAKRKIRERIKNEKDPEIRALLKQGFDVTFQEDM